MKNKHEGVTLIALIITIIVLLILAGVTISMIMGDNGILNQAEESKIQTDHGSVKEGISLQYSDYKIDRETGNQEVSSFWDFLLKAGIIDANGVLNTENLVGSELSTGKGNATDKKNVYILEETEDEYILKYYDDNTSDEELWQVDKGDSEFSQGIPEYNDEMKTLKQGDYVIYDTGIEGVGEVVCRVLYDASSEYGVQIISDCIKENGEYVKITFGVNSRDYANDEYKEKTLKTYNDAIKTLNTNAIKYLNSSYAIDARCVGSNPIDKNSEPSDYAENTWGENFGVKIEDNNYETDYNTLSSLEMIETEAPYWLASRYIEYEDLYGGSNINRVICYVRMVGQEALPIYKDGWGIYWLDYSNEVTNGLRPVFLLKGNLHIVSGDGKSESTAYRFN